MVFHESEVRHDEGFDVERRWKNVKDVMQKNKALGKRK